MGEHWITTNGSTYRVSATGETGADIDGIIEWLCTDHGAPAAITALSRQQVLARIDKSAIPVGFPEPDVVIGDAARDAGGYVRGWLAATVQAWVEAQRAPAPVESAGDGGDEQPPAAAAGQETVTDRGVDDDDVPGEGEQPPGTPTGEAVGARLWSGAPPSADRMVAILTSRGAVTPSGVRLTRGALPTGADLARFVWHRWPHKPDGKTKGGLPQVWITAPALQAAGMTPPKTALTTSADLSDTVAALFQCQVTSARAGWFTAVFTAPGGDTEGRRVQLVLLPFLWLDAASQRPKDEGLAGTRGTPTELPDDEDAAVEILGRRIAWLSSIAEGVLPAARPATVGAALMDSVRRRSRASRRLEACPLPDTVYAETPRLDPDLDNWKNMPHTAKGDSVDVEVDQRSAFLASAGQVELGFGMPVELAKIDPAVFADKPPFGLWRVTTPPAAGLDGLTRRLPLPHGHMSWDNPSTFWASTRAVEQLLAPVAEGGAGLSVGELTVSGAWVWPQHARLLRTWADLLRAQLVDAQAQDRPDQVEIVKNIYKAFLGRLAGSQHPPGQRHYQQPAWAATIHADTRWRAIRYAVRVAAEHDLYPIAARDIDTFVYRIPAEVDADTVLGEESEANGKYRVKKIRAGDEG